jgi:hypothetical protein
VRLVIINPGDTTTSECERGTGPDTERRCKLYSGVKQARALLCMIPNDWVQIKMMMQKMTYNIKHGQARVVSP